MNLIKKIPLDQLGYHFITPEFLDANQDEYYLRNLQNRNGITYRKLTAYEIEALVRNRNSSDDWNNLLVSDAFNPELVKNCKFFGLVRIGKLEPFFLEYSQLKVPVGLYNSTIISCDFGDNVVIDNVNYLSHYIIGSEAIIANVNELMTTPHAKFGNGVVKEGEHESVRIWMEICNENGGRSVIPFNGMLPGDAWLWSKFRSDDLLMDKFKDFTEKKFDQKRGYYGKVGDRTVIKNCAIIKDVWIGSDAYLKGANKLKNLTINSQPGAQTQIGEGCELVNGIIGFGCRLFYGVKAVRFIMASNSQLKYGARLINSYLGNNATISCCEVLNSLIFPAHEQHHNNSFLCAALVMGQSNIAAGATIGSNHNSRSPDGELIAGRGFWPGLCVSLKHNSRFASFSMVAKGDYAAELDVRFPFCLVSQNTAKDQLQLMPGYWFFYNMYALARNAWKYVDRDKRPDKIQCIEYDYLAPDTVNEMMTAIGELEYLVGKAVAKIQQLPLDNNDALTKLGKAMLETNDSVLTDLEVLADKVENSKRKTVVLKSREAWQLYRDLVTHYGILAFMDAIETYGDASLAMAQMPARLQRQDWLNVGGQLIPTAHVHKKLIQPIHRGKLASWDHVHQFYEAEAESYPQLRLQHALATLKEISGTDPWKAPAEQQAAWIKKAVQLNRWMLKGIVSSREKDYTNPFRKMAYDSMEEMDKVIGSLDSNSFIALEKEKAKAFEQKAKRLQKRLALAMA